MRFSSISWFSSVEGNLFTDMLPNRLAQTAVFLLQTWRFVFRKTKVKQIAFFKVELTFINAM
jgi:hypothetical protein